MNEMSASGNSLRQRLLDYRNRAEELRVLADDMHEGPASLMLSVAAGYDHAAETIQAIPLQLSEPLHHASASPPSTGP